jgi:Tfp pilus assembly protein PilX
MNHRIHIDAAFPSAQTGVALVFSLVILLVLTILGISSLRISTLEQAMSGNTQEGIRAFQAAESGLARSLSDTATFSSPSSGITTVRNYTFTDMGAQVTVETNFIQSVPPGRSAVPTGQGSADAAHFDQRAVGTTIGTGARSVTHQGVKKYMPSKTN